MLSYVTLALRVFLGGYFLYAAVPKIAEPLVFATSISHYEMMPSFLVHPFALVIPWLELLVGAALVAGWRTRTAAWLAGAMLVMFTVAVAWAVINGLVIDCGCFGSQGGETTSWAKVATNTLMIIGCALLIWHPSSALSLDSRRTEV